MDNKRLYTSGEVAKACGVTLRTVLNWIAKGLLKAHRLPGARGDARILKSDLVDFMREHQMPIPVELETSERKALIVDDERAMANSIQRVLRSLGFKTLVASDGFSAGLLYAQEKPQLMTLDLQMPKLNGMEVLQRIQHQKSGRILVISGMDATLLQATLELGADAYLAKPFDNEELEALLGQWF
ncbi:DNA binding domain-containing protein, excisionase family [Alteromonadaceae bacterium Bs31]|nr:DNA binding domain-containing protein, excisionase family [Alteromonadaceae bacterium Bs31]